MGCVWARGVRLAAAIGGVRGWRECWYSFILSLGGSCHGSEKSLAWMVRQIVVNTSDRWHLVAGGVQLTCRTSLVRRTFTVVGGELHQRVHARAIVMLL